jgi:predicted ATPase
VTLTGPPGVGKSRLALEAARALEPECPEGVWLVDFARAGDAQDAVRLLADAVDVRGADPLARVTSRLRAAGACIVLDACEHVLGEAARITSTLLAQCPRVRILATSREALRVAGEARVPIAPLALPVDGTAATHSAAVQLFLERARTARPGFEPDAEDLALVAEVSRRVDGLPLAIELAAARVNVLGLAELVSILERRAAFLRDTPATDPSRIALQGLVEWSYDLLHADEKTLLQQLAVHRGGASLASLSALAASHGLSEAAVAHLLAGVVDKSIVSASFAGRVARYDMLDTVRDYVLERLAESDGLAAARAGHSRVLRGARRGGARGAARAAMAAVAEPARTGERQLLGRARLRARRAGPWRRHSPRNAGVVLRLGRAGFRGTALSRSRAGCHGR